MSTLTKTFVILNLVFSIAFVSVTATVLSQRTHWKAQYQGKERELSQAKEQWNDKDLSYKTALEGLTKARDAAEQLAIRRGDQITDLERRVTDLTANVERVQKEKADAMAMSDRLSQNVDRLTRDLTTARADISRMQTEFQNTKGELDDRNTTLVGVRSQLAALELKYKDMLNRFNIANDELTWFKNYASLVEKISPAVDAQVRQGRETEVPPEPIRAAVKAVDQSMGVIVLNVGSSNAPPVKKGYRFLIYRGREFVAAVRVTNVEQNMCASEIVQPTREDGMTVQIGDEAITTF